MLKGGTTGVLTAFFIAASSLTFAQDGSDYRRLSLSDLNALTVARVAVVKAALQLTKPHNTFEKHDGIERFRNRGVRNVAKTPSQHATWQLGQWLAGVHLRSAAVIGQGFPAYRASDLDQT
jgi:hypothetical protein